MTAQINSDKCANCHSVYCLRRARIFVTHISYSFEIHFGRSMLIVVTSNVQLVDSTAHAHTHTHALNSNIPNQQQAK